MMFNTTGTVVPGYTGGDPDWFVVRLDNPDAVRWGLDNNPGFSARVASYWTNGVEPRVLPVGTRVRVTVNSIMLLTISEVLD